MTCNNCLNDDKCMCKKLYDEYVDDIYHKVDPLAFKNHLTSQEEREFSYEEKKINDQRDQLIKKYNKIVSDRISHAILIEEVNKAIGSCSDELKYRLQKTIFATIPSLIDEVNIAIASCSQELKDKFNIVLRSNIPDEITIHTMDNKVLQTLLLVLTFAKKESYEKKSGA